MQFLEVLRNIVLMVVILGVLISLHELGHLIAAKSFHVYCFDYSIGFGPALLHKKKKGAETYFSIRAIPLGGYVSMYGEPGAVPQGMEEPPEERSLNAIHKGKKMVVLSAGVITNFILGLILVAISAFAFPQYYYAYAGYSETVQVEKAGEVSDFTISVNYVAPTFDGLALSYLESVKPEGSKSEDFVLPMWIYGANVNIIDDEVYVYRENGDRLEDFPRVAVYYPTNLIEDRCLEDFIRLYPAAKDKDGNFILPEQPLQDLGIHYVPDVSDANGYLSYSSSNTLNCTFSISPRFALIQEGMKKEDFYRMFKEATYAPNADQIKMTILQDKVSSSGVLIHPIKQWNGWEKGWKVFGEKTGLAITAVGQGVASLFTPGGFQNLSSVVGMTAALSVVTDSGGAANIFFFAGLISINLAFFNLLPFPGLDGWQMLTTTIEGIFRKKIPAKAQGIASMIGLGLLFALGIAVIIKDIIALF